MESYSTKVLMSVPGTYFGTYLARIWVTILSSKYLTHTPGTYLDY
jgi:hypothetical protein